jgi:flagellar assembly protein FliH
VAVEEKNSLHSFLEGDNLKPKYKLQTHCFPEIKSKDFINRHDNVDGASTKDIQDESNKNSNNIDKQTQPWPKEISQDGDNELKQLIKQAHEEGYSSGFEDGRIEEKKRIDALAKTVLEAVSNLESYRLQLLERAEEGVIKLVLALARKIILKEPSVSHEIILNITQNALKTVVDPTELKIKVNPDELKILKENQLLFEMILGTNPSVMIEPDTTISAGGCIIETDFGDIDARIGSQLDAMEKALMNELNLLMQRKAR